MLSAVQFSISRDAAWAPGVETPHAWGEWAEGKATIGTASDPTVQAMPAMLRRRLGFLGKMALHVAYECLDGRTDIPAVFCSRHGEVSRSVDLLRDLAAGEPISPTSFGLSVHNAIGGMLSIARGDTVNNIALSAGRESLEHAVIEACGLLDDGAPAVLLVAYDCPLPHVYAPFREPDEQACAWAWLMVPPQRDVISLSWQSDCANHDATDTPPWGELDVLRFYLRRDRRLTRRCGNRSWNWSRDV